MKRFVLLGILAVVSVSNAQVAQKLTSADYARAERMLPNYVSSLVERSSVNPVWLPSGDFWYVNRKGRSLEFVLINSKEGTRKTAGSAKDLLQGLPESKRLPEVGYTQVLSPDGSRLAFIRDWNLWVKDLNTGNEKALTTDGVKDFGYATDNAGWKHTDRPILLWSPDSKKIATFKQDQRHVHDMYLVRTKVGAPELEQWKYPLPGDSDIVRIHRVIIDLERGALIPLKMIPDAHRSTLCDDISCEGGFDDNIWNADGSQLAFISTTRDHKKATLRVAEAATGLVRTVFEEDVVTQYESGRGASNWRFLPESNEFIWYSEKDNWGHLYLRDLKTGQLKNRITQGDFVVTEIVRVDEKNRIIYFKAKGKVPGSNPYFTNFYSIGFNGKNLQWLTPELGNHEISLSPDGNYFIDRYSQPDVLPVTVLKGIKGNLVCILEQTDVSRLMTTGWKPPAVFKVKSANRKFDLYGLMFTPGQMIPGKKYPVVVNIYPGPQGGSVSNWSFLPARGDNQALAELGFVVVQLEGSCNPNRSKAFHDACYGDISENTLPDQISGLNQLAEKFPFLDLNRVGIWGHSGGGFATAAALLRYPEFFKVGVSQSGNHDNRNYEDDWGERYIGLLTRNGKGSDNYAPQANQNYAANLKGKLLIAHGGMDDNVPPYNAYLLVDALIKANKDFDLIIFPNARHGYGSDNRYMMRRRWDYFVKNLMGAEPPKEYEIR